MLGQTAKAIFNSGVSLHYGTGDDKIFRKSTRLAFGSSVEIVDGLGKLTDIAYSGIEETITELVKGGPSAAVGSGSFSGGVILKSRHLLSNEDIEKCEVEKVKFRAS